MGRKLTTVHEEQLKDPEYAREYAALEEEFALARALIQARRRAGLTQRQVAERMGTTQSAVARMESGRSASLASIKRYAEATGSRLTIRLEPGQG